MPRIPGVNATASFGPSSLLAWLTRRQWLGRAASSFGALLLLARECAKLDPGAEQALAEEGLAEDYESMASPGRGGRE